MKRILQEDGTGCGIACIAMITGRSYQQIKDELIKMPGYSAKGPFYTDASELRALAKSQGVSLIKRKRKFKEWKLVPNGSILAIRFKEKNSEQEWHWVVFNRINGREFVIDPKKSIKTDQRTDFGRIKAKWYLPIIST